MASGTVTTPGETTPTEVVVVTNPDGSKSTVRRHKCRTWPWLIAGAILGVVFMLVYNSKRGS